MRYFVTGGLGFVGSNLVRTLIENGHKPTIYDNASRGRPEDLDDISDAFVLHVEDIRDAARLKDAMQGHDVVVHLAAIPSVKRSVDDPLGCHQVNSDGTLNVLLAARELNVQRVVFASSGAVYGGVATAEPRSEASPTVPASPYGLEKLMGEHYCRLFTTLFGLETVALRYANLFGPGQDPESPYASAVPRFIGLMTEGQPAVIFGDGLQTRDFTFVDNAVRATLLAAHVPGIAGEVFNISGGETHSVLDLVATLNRLLGANIPPVHSGPRPGEVRHARTDIGKARRQLGFEPSATLEEGLERTIAWHRRRQQTVDSSAIEPRAPERMESAPGFRSGSR